MHEGKEDEWQETRKTIRGLKSTHILKKNMKGSKTRENKKQHEWDQDKRLRVRPSNLIPPS